eukprot:7214068-Pyramimonas_sp.AAC.1
MGHPFICVYLFVCPGSPSVHRAAHSGLHEKPPFGGAGRAGKPAPGMVRVRSCRVEVAAACPNTPSSYQYPRLQREGTD